MLGMTYISLNISHLVGVVGFSNSSPVTEGDATHMCKRRYSTGERQRESGGENDVCLGLCAKEEVALLSSVEL